MEVEVVLKIVDEAASAIMQIYRSGDFDVTLKGDNSPVTKADLVASEILISRLNQITNLPVVSEEAILPYEERKKFKRLWLVDPLDGTKDFLERDDEFTVNVALVEENTVVFGVVAAPALGSKYYAHKGRGAFRVDSSGVNQITYNSDRAELICADSRFHSSPETQDFCQKNKIKEVVKSGSAIKMCKLAEGKVDVYPRFGTTMEWDIAASQIIAEEAGCKVVDIKTRNPLTYNKEDLRVNGFIAYGIGRNFIW